VDVRIAVVGTGAIGAHLLDAMAAGRAGPIEIVAIADVPGREDHLSDLAARYHCAWHIDPLAVLRESPDLVVEAAAPSVVRQYAQDWLEGGADVMVMSVGALADLDLLESLSLEASHTGRRVLVPSGAVGGLDVLRAARIGGLDEVELRTTKPPRALKGAPWFERHPVDLDGLSEATVVFEGPATEAVEGFPANLNVVAALSLAGIGPARTRVVLVADPAGERNVHEVTARGAFGEMHLRLENRPTPGNPKTSLLAALSALALLRQLTEPVRVGS
jgi:aspartate dehydrogenase